MQRLYSFIIPVFNRPDEIRELLYSFTLMLTDVTYEILIIEDGSTQSSESVVDEYKNQLPISYYFKKNSGPGDSRNFGMQKAKGDYFIILDSDCLLPSHYLTTVNQFLSQSNSDCYGGADAAHTSFTPLQKAINYVMTSFYTTGGIRGSKSSIQKFEPRSFNMGISKSAFEATGGFSDIHPGEDPDLSQRLLKAGFKTQFIPNAFVYHKRRISWNKFYMQVRKFGLVRPILNSWHPQSAKITFWFPTLFMGYTLLSLFLLFLGISTLLWPLLGYLALIGLDASVKNRNVLIGGLSIFAVFVQFFGYGWAFLNSSIQIGLLKKNPRLAYPALFFK
jgi:glycosyltransferase involved in cell wall biosynthesis